MNTPGYEKLAEVFQRAFDQAANGKGKERHATGDTPFEKQPMALINMTLGSIDGYLYQAAKKAQEARRLPDGRAQAELLGAINYLAGAVIAMDTWAAGTLPGGEVAAQAAPATDADGWIEWRGGSRPELPFALVQVRLRDGMVREERKTESFSWLHMNHPFDIIAYRVSK